MLLINIFFFVFMLNLVCLFHFSSTQTPCRRHLAVTYSPVFITVPSALGYLTSLFGMGRGYWPRYNHRVDSIIP